MQKPIKCPADGQFSALLTLQASKKEFRCIYNDERSKAKRKRNRWISFVRITLALFQSGIVGKYNQSFSLPKAPRLLNRILLCTCRYSARSLLRQTLYSLRKGFTAVNENFFYQNWSSTYENLIYRLLVRLCVP